jgi:hypothetical protein
VRPGQPQAFDTLAQGVAELEGVRRLLHQRWNATNLTRRGGPVDSLRAQKELGIKMDPAALTAFIASMGAGIVITGYKWLSNRGTWERGIVDAYGVYLTGQSATTHQVVVTTGGTPTIAQPQPQK